jgi:HSP20 family protein
MALIKYQSRQGRPAFLDTFFDDFFTRDRFFSEMANSGSFKPAVNISENEKGYFIELAAPGFSKGDLSVEIDHGTLTISGERKATHQEGSTQFKVREFTAQRFSRSFTLPESVQEDRINAQYENGIVMLTLPIDAEHTKGARRIAVK